MFHARAAGAWGGACILQRGLLEPGFVSVVSGSLREGEYLCINVDCIIIFIFKLLLSIKSMFLGEIIGRS